MVRQVRQGGRQHGRHSEVDLPYRTPLRLAVQDNNLDQFDTNHHTENLNGQQFGRSAGAEVEAEVCLSAKLRSLNRLNTHDADSPGVPEVRHDLRGRARFLLDACGRRAPHECYTERPVRGPARVTSGRIAQ